ncbi:hypothetical protein RY831_30875 [Noviherbaspirillum sp. CPCC 100848]|uniref:Uncharacterized protein n=1 Tax=Noviherbaspirillum album TaxID=3080276 RepID=A0ABU6JIN6_9BURK|nr:hypothetical protein [Noviherbaspirillum sp. CPCC 100848]MEC4723547.1 hypothetical protein [Noviherbaspirillum sp. CPCC 100848]
MLISLDTVARYRPTDLLSRQAMRLMLYVEHPSIFLLIWTFGIGYSSPTQLIQAIEDNVIAKNELERYTDLFQTEVGSTFELQRSRGSTGTW